MRNLDGGAELLIIARKIHDAGLRSFHQSRNGNQSGPMGQPKVLLPAMALMTVRPKLFGPADCSFRFAPLRVGGAQLAFHLVKCRPQAATDVLQPSQGHPGCWASERDGARHIGHLFDAEVVPEMASS